MIMGTSPFFIFYKIKSLLTVFNNNKVNILCNNEDRTIPIGHVATSEICLWRIYFFLLTLFSLSSPSEPIMMSSLT